MRVSAAFFFVILLWSTTPLAIKWSGEGPGYLFGAASRMVIGLVFMLPLLLLLKQKMPWTKAAWLTYIAIATQIYGAMLSVYWAAQFIPSGWISVIFGLTPMMTAIMAALCLNESSLGPLKLLSYVSGFAGLLVMFGSALDVGHEAVIGIAAVVFSAFIQSASAVSAYQCRHPGHLPGYRWIIARGAGLSGDLVMARRAVAVQLACRQPDIDRLSGHYCHHDRFCALFLYSDPSSGHPGSINHVDDAGIVFAARQ